MKSHIENFKKILERKVGNYNVKIFIGGQDENTLYTLIKKMVLPEIYWNIEDGFANYYDRNSLYKSSIWLKRVIFKHFYGYSLPIAYAHGQANYDRSFRMAPEISTGDKAKHVPLAPILKEYLLFKASKCAENLTWLDKFKDSTTLIVTDISTYSEHKVDTNTSEVYKFHPKDVVPVDIGIRYIEEKIPLELLPFVLSNLKKIRFEVMSSSILNLSCMDIDVKIEISFNPKNSEAENVISFACNKNEINTLYAPQNKC